MAFNRFGTSLVVAFDISRGFNRTRHAALPSKLKSYGIYGWFLYFRAGNRCFQVVNRWLLLLLVAPKAPFFTILFSCYIVFLMILSVILPFIWQPSPLQHWGSDKYQKKIAKKQETVHFSLIRGMLRRIKFLPRGRGC